MRSTQGAGADAGPILATVHVTVIDWPMSYVYGFVALGFVMMTFRAIQVALLHWRRGWSVLERPEEAY